MPVGSWQAKVCMMRSMRVRKTDGKPGAMIHTSNILKVCDKDSYEKEHMSFPTGNANAEKMKNIEKKKKECKMQDKRKPPVSYKCTPSTPINAQTDVSLFLCLQSSRSAKIWLASGAFLKTRCSISAMHKTTFCLGMKPKWPISISSCNSLLYLQASPGTCF